MANTDVGGPSSTPGEGGDCHVPAVVVSSGHRRKWSQENEDRGAASARRERRPSPLLDHGGRAPVPAEGGDAGLAPSSAHLKRDWAAGPEDDGQDDGRKRSASRVDALHDPRQGLLFDGGAFPFEDEDPRGDAVNAEVSGGAG